MHARALSALRDTLEGVEPMGRGRQKAKATKVARKLKYFSPETDYAALERELSTASGPEADDQIDYEALASKYDIPDEDAEWDAPSETAPTHGTRRR
ncbi:hypothetical protein GCM10011612_04370 [Actinomyces gaoshouyii]|uniref:DUF3073 domain-containing protein n=2 Tax=Actinomyces gaoshouyii TaxID=1960083 RepID=A0A8H9LFE2_9ACTO|nr:hypothetical protein GCM10011612_04370 [Actinomyces gaoshouyii]